MLLYKEAKMATLQTVGVQLTKFSSICLTFVKMSSSFLMVISLKKYCLDCHPKISCGTALFCLFQTCP